ncbi:hypothetical protein OF83DRAFT_1149104 [Amylostereum chailletii]|nr:hypothetical protein OF83DRAFT_1149104 [Amylostereum chailletii]
MRRRPVVSMVFLSVEQYFNQCCAQSLVDEALSPCRLPDDMRPTSLLFYCPRMLSFSYNLSTHVLSSWSTHFCITSTHLHYMTGNLHAAP